MLYTFICDRIIKITSLFSYVLYLHGKSTPSIHKPGVWHIIADSEIVANRFLLTTVMTKRILTLCTHSGYIPPRLIHIYTSRSDCHTVDTILVWCHTTNRLARPKDSRIKLYMWSNHYHVQNNLLEIDSNSYCITTYVF